MKIPRIEQGNLPSSIMPVSAPDLSGAKIMESAAGLFERGAVVASNIYDRKLAERARVEKVRQAELEKEQKVLAEALAKKKSIQDAVDAGILSAEYEESSRDLMEATKQEFFNDPEKTPEALIPRLNSLAAQYQKRAADNPDVELHVVKNFASQNQSVVRETGVWSQKRSTERTKEKMTEMEARLINNASTMSLPVLEGTIAVSRQDALWAAAYGPKVEAEWARLEQKMYNSYAETQAKNDPFPVIEELKRPDNFFAKRLAEEDYKALDNKARWGAKQMENTRIENALASAYKSDYALMDAMRMGKVDGAFITAERTRIEGAKLAAALEVKEGKRTEANKREEWAILDKRLELVKLADKYQYLHSTPDNDLRDDDAPAELSLALQKVLTAKAKPTAQNIADLRVMTVEAFSNGQLTPSASRAITARLRKIEERKAEDTQKQDGVFGVAFTDNQAGVLRLKTLLGSEPLSDKNANRVWMQYLMGQEKFEKDNGTDPDRKQMVKIAEDAYNTVVLRQTTK
jgi:hypothetical protein